MRTAKRCIPCLRLSSRSNNWGTKRCVGIFVTNQQWNAQTFTQTSCKQEVTREWHVKGHARDPRGFAARSRVVAQLASPPQISLPFTLAAIFKTLKNVWPIIESVSIKKEGRSQSRVEPGPFVSQSFSLSITQPQRPAKIPNNLRTLTSKLFFF